jgi:hypothetical protein
MLTDGERRRFYPALHMGPFHSCVSEASDIVSAWMPTHTRPIIPGIYECKFRTTGDAILPLVWEGMKFIAAHDGRRVAMGDFLTWRGVLA